LIGLIPHTSHLTPHPLSPYDIFDAADWNVAVSNQPHSEIAALALFLDYLQQGEELNAKFEHAELEIVPRRKGKEVEVKLKRKKGAKIK
ncbi:MAG TPA: hypothetical protein C5S37_13065, partial [Methanophagales archaeon]|nr:hypothetical protein [Methanophagales archaeon]